MMDAHQYRLYQRLQDYDLESALGRISFSQQLAQTHGWSPYYAQRVLKEYKRFVFLAITAQHPIAPPEAIEQVWLQHLTHSYAYWGVFCPQVLRSPLHHRPLTDGEELLWANRYPETLAAYEFFFQEQAPYDIWPSLERFSTHPISPQPFQRRRYWIVPQSLGFQSFELGAVCAAVLWPWAAPTLEPPLVEPLASNFCLPILSLLPVPILETVASQGWPAGLGEHGQIWAIALAGLVLAYGLRGLLQLSHLPKLAQLATVHTSTATLLPPLPLHLYEIAYLTGGPHHAIHTALISLIQRGHCVPAQSFQTLRLTTPLTGPHHPLEPLLLQALTTAVVSPAQAPPTLAEQLPQLEQILTFELAGLGQTLRLYGLQLAPQQAQLARWLPLLCASLAIAGPWGALAWAQRAIAPGPLAGAGVLTLAALPLLWRSPRRSWHGDRLVDRLRHNYAALRDPYQAQQNNQWDLAFALFGNDMLQGTSLQSLASLFQASQFSELRAREIGSLRHWCPCTERWPGIP